jgi:hypothetical protein
MCSCQRTLKSADGNYHPTGFKNLLSGLARPACFAGNAPEMVGLTGVEPVTLRLSSACSNQLSYRPVVNPGVSRDFRLQTWLVELRRFELLTYSLQSYRSTN